MIGSLDNQALIGGGAAAIGMVATVSGFNKIREGKNCGDTAKGVVAIAFGAMAGAASVYAFSQSEITGGYFPESWVDQVPTWEETEETVCDTASWIKEQTWDRIPSWGSESTSEVASADTQTQPEVHVIHFRLTPENPNAASLTEANTAIGKGSTEECVQALETFSASSTVRKIANAFGGSEKFCSLPQLEWKGSFHAGGTGYIDGVKTEDMTASVMRGQDPADRPYVAMHTIGTRRGNTHDGVETLFQRYSTDAPDVWVSGGHSTPMHLVDSAMNEEDLDKLAQLARGEEVSLNSDKYLSKIDRGSIHLAGFGQTTETVATAPKVDQANSVPKAESARIPTDRPPNSI